MAFFVMFGNFLSAQMVQYGCVVEMNSGGKALSGVAITIPSAHDCQPTSSDAFGLFRLSFGEHKVGDVVLGLNAKKYGYEMVNHHVSREGYTLTDKDSLRIVMAPVGKVAEARTRYYALLEAASIRRYDSTMSFFNRQYAQQLITEPELKYWESQAEAELKTAYLRMDEYADMMARINQDDLKGTALYSDVMVLDSYTQQYESGFAADGPRYAKSCYYLGIIFRDAQDRVMAENCFRKALRMYEMLNEMEVGNFRTQIDEIKEMLKSFE